MHVSIFLLNIRQSDSRSYFCGHDYDCRLLLLILNMNLLSSFADDQTARQNHESCSALQMLQLRRERVSVGPRPTLRLMTVLLASSMMKMTLFSLERQIRWYRERIEVTFMNITSIIVRWCSTVCDRELDRDACRWDDCSWMIYCRTSAIKAGFLLASASSHYTCSTSIRSVEEYRS
jgi:hypothetical protein